MATTILKVGPEGVKEDGQKYRIETMNDLATMLTEENIEMVFTDMKAFFSQYIKLRDKGIELPFSSFSWIDDWTDEHKQKHQEYINR